MSRGLRLRLAFGSYPNEFAFKCDFSEIYLKHVSKISLYRNSSIKWVVSFYITKLRYQLLSVLVRKRLTVTWFTTTLVEKYLAPNGTYIYQILSYMYMYEHREIEMDQYLTPFTHYCAYWGDFRHCCLIWAFHKHYDKPPYLMTRGQHMSLERYHVCYNRVASSTVPGVMTVVIGGSWEVYLARVLRPTNRGLGRFASCLATKWRPS